MQRNKNDSFFSVPWNAIDLFVFYVLIIGCVYTGGTIYDLLIAKSPNYVWYGDLYGLFWYIVSTFILKLIISRHENGWRILIRFDDFNKSLKSEKIQAYIFILVLTFSFIYISFLFLPDKLADEFSPLYLLLAIIVGPAAEEIWFRGFFYRFIRNKVEVKRAIVYLTILFALFHFNNFSLFAVIFSICITFYYEKTKALYNCIFIHSMCNFVIIILKSCWSMV